jgi:hypothetical protein
VATGAGAATDPPLVDPPLVDPPPTYTMRAGAAGWVAETMTTRCTTRLMITGRGAEAVVVAPTLG